MTLDAFFDHAATIQRATTTLDAYGNAVLAWADVATVVPCRLVEKRERVWSDQLAESLIQTSYLLLIGPSADLLERDRVLVGGLAYTVRSLVTRRSKVGAHKSASLERVS